MAEAATARPGPRRSWRSARRSTATIKKIEAGDLQPPHQLAGLIAEAVGVPEAERTASEAEGGWAIFMIHRVGADTHSLFVDEEVHRHCVDWLAERPTVWPAPVREVAAALAARGAAG